MRLKSIIYFFLMIFFSSGCKTSSNTAIVAPAAPVTTKVEKKLSEEDQLKFDYFFQQALKERLNGNLEAAFKLYQECRKIDADSPVVLYEVGSIFMIANQLEAAKSFLEGAVQNNPTNIHYKEALVNVYLKLEDYKSAIKVFESILASDPNNEDRIYIYARLLGTTKDYNKSIQAYNSLQQITGIVPEFSITKANYYLRLGQKKKSQQEIDALVKKFPYDPDIFRSLGFLYSDYDDNTNALINFQKAYNLGGEGSSYVFDLGRYFQERGDTIKFVDYYNIGIQSDNISLDEKLDNVGYYIADEKRFNTNQYIVANFISSIENLSYQSGNSYSFLGRYFHLVRNAEKAEAYLIKAMDEQLDDMDIWELGIQYLLQKDDFKMLTDYSKNAVNLFPDVPFFMFFYGAGLHQEKQEAEAVKVLIEADSLTRDQDPLKVQILSLIGDSYYALGQPDSAYASYDKALLINANHTGTLNNYAYYLSLEEHDLDKAEKMSQKCTILEPGNATFLDTHAWVLFKMGRFFEAKFIMERAIDNSPEPSAVLLEHYGDILFFNQDIDRAIEEWNKALELDGDSDILKKKIENRQYYKNDLTN